jgi:hypothetical protein
MTNTTKIASGFGLDIKFYEYNDAGTKTNLVCEIKFANESAISTTRGDPRWATGGKMKRNKVRFDDSYTGTWNITTQMATVQIYQLLAGGDPSQSATSVVFKSDPLDKTRYYIVEGTTVWKAEDGTVYAQTNTALKASVNSVYEVTYTGDGDPLSMSLQLALTENPSGEIYKTDFADTPEQE